MKRKIVSRIVSMGLVLPSLLLGLLTVPVYADLPTLPHTFHGNLTINGNPAPVGTEVEARVDGDLAGIITTIVEGQYGGPEAFDPKLIVQGDIEPNTLINFWINGVDTGQTYPFQSGRVTRLDLSAAVAHANEVVTFPDPNLEAAIRAAIGKPTGSIYRVHLERLTYLNAAGSDFSSGGAWSDVSDISGGEKQRIFLTSSSLLKRKIYFLDEPTSGLDSECKRKVINYFLNECASTVVAVTHDQEWMDNSNIKIDLNRGRYHDIYY